MKLFCEVGDEYIMCGEICMLPWKPVLQAHVGLFYNRSAQVADWRLTKCIQNQNSRGKRSKHPGITLAAVPNCLRQRVSQIWSRKSARVHSATEVNSI